MSAKIGGPRCEVCKQPAGMCKCPRPKPPESPLRDRCLKFYRQMATDAMLRQHDPVDDLVAFVVAEIGRTADLSLDKTLPLCCYFANDTDREEFIAAVHEALPNMTARKMP